MGTVAECAPTMPAAMHWQSPLPVPGHRRGTSRAIALGIVLAAHLLIIVLLGIARVVVSGGGGTVAQVSLLSDPGKPPDAPPALPFKPLQVPRPEIVVAVVPAFTMQVEAIAEPVTAPATPAPSPPGSGAVGAPAERVQVPDLELLCPDRRGPSYPPESRRLREQGEVTLRVELDDHGAVSLASVIRSSGHARLDDAARRTVLAWHCEPARHDGRAVPAVATQSLEFVLERRAGGGRRG